MGLSSVTGVPRSLWISTVRGRYAGKRGTRSVVSPQYVRQDAQDLFLSATA